MSERVHNPICSRCRGPFQWDMLHIALDVADEENERLRSALAVLVALKDGPRDDNYRASKDAAWAAARSALAAGASGTDEQPAGQP